MNQLSDEFLKRVALALPSAPTSLNSALKLTLGLSNLIKTGQALTIDYNASQLIGTPVVVLQTNAIDSPIEPTWMRHLTHRELEVAALMAQGLPNKRIALRLGISVGTVKDHVHRVLQKSSLPSRAALCSQWRNS